MFKHAYGSQANYEPLNAKIAEQGADAASLYGYYGMFVEAYNAFDADNSFRNLE